MTRDYYSAIEYLRDARDMCNDYIKNDYCDRCYFYSEAYEACYREQREYYEPDKAVEVVTKWSKEHPILTNAQKFEEVFGYPPQSPIGMSCPPKPETWDCSALECPVCMKWWDEPYKESEHE